MKKILQELLYKGGLKLKLISFVFISIFLAISIQNYFIIPFIKESIEKKAFEVSFSTIQHIADFSSFALLERTYENQLSLKDAIKKLQNSHLDGLLGIAIYQRQKDLNNSSFKYLAGFGTDIDKLPLDKELLQKVQNATNENISYDTYNIHHDKNIIKTYRFIQPIIYNYEGKNILLGFAVLYYDQEAIVSIINQVLDYIYLTAFIILLLSTLYAYFIGSRVTKPITEITQASCRITKGDLNIHLNIKTNDEIQNLAEHFNTMVAWLQEKNKLQKFVSNSTIHMIQNSPETSPVLGGEYKSITFLFCDIRDFTSLNEKKSPQEVIDILNFYFALQAEIIQKYGGDIDKFIGDEIMASFSQNNGSKNAIQCALEIQKTIDEKNKQRSKQDQTICSVGIGISKGEVVVGNVGYQEHMDYTAIGLPVNLTARLCSSAKGGEVLIDKKTYKESQCKCNYIEIEPLTLKGISKDVVAYSLKVSKNG